MKVQAFDLLLPFIVACETDCGEKRKKFAACNVH